MDAAGAGDVRHRMPAKGKKRTAQSKSAGTGTGSKKSKSEPIAEQTTSQQSEQASQQSEQTSQQSSVCVCSSSLSIMRCCLISDQLKLFRDTQTATAAGAATATEKVVAPASPVAVSAKPSPSTPTPPLQPMTVSVCPSSLLMSHRFRSKRSDAECCVLCCKCITTPHHHLQHCIVK